VRTSPGRRAAGRAAGAGEAGFTLLETLVSLALICAMLAAVGPFLVNGLLTANVQQDRQFAVHLADDAMERVRALGRTGLLEGRSRAAVQGQWAQAPAAVRDAYASAMLCAWDPRLSPEPAAACDGNAPVDDTAPGAQAPLPTVPVEVTVAGVPYLQNWYVGPCWQPADAGARCGDSEGTHPGVEDLPYIRVVVAVTWPHRSCAAGLCVFQTTTLVSPATDPVFNLW
jgi:prepilin-type N-terminal cleavage/methylation domain-containing protein